MLLHIVRNMRKGVILAAGKGENLYPFTENTPKALITIMGKTLISHALDRLKRNSITDIIIVIDKLDTKIKAKIQNGANLGLKIQYVRQQDPGIDGAIKALKPHFSEEEQFVLLHTDIISQPGILRRTLESVKAYKEAKVGLAVTLENDPQDFGVVNLTSEGLVANVFPSGEKLKGNYVVAGVFVLTGKLLLYLDENTPFNLCFNRYIKDGGKVIPGIWNDKWVDVGYPWDILRAIRLLFSQMNKTIICADVKIEQNVIINGFVIIESGAKIFSGTVINGPAYIGKNVVIGNNSLIRAGAVLEEGSSVGMGCEIKGSVLFQKTSVARLSYIGDSIVGTKASIHGSCITINSFRGKEISVHLKGKKHKLDLKKFGTIVGPEAYIFPNCTLYPGSVIEPGAIVKPNQVINN